MSKPIEIIQKENKILRKKAQEVKSSEFNSPKLSEILDQMRQALEQEEDGVALAAPQIAISKRIFIVSPKVLKTEGVIPETPLVYINPEIIWTSKDNKLLDEGCLSVRWWYGKIRRRSKVTIKAQDESGNFFEVKASKLLAQIFQHETDHLNGTLFIDNAEDLKELPPGE